MERCCRSTGTRTAHISNDCREWSTPNVCTTVDHGNSVASWFGVPEPGGGRNIRERKSALHTNFWEDVKYYGACEGRNRGFRPFPTAIRSPFSQFWAEGAAPAKLPPKVPSRVGPHTSCEGFIKSFPQFFLLFRQADSSKTIWKETKDSESHICADHVKLSNFVNFYMKSSRSD